MTKILCPISKNSRDLPLAPAIVCGSRQLSYTQLDRLVAQAALRLQTAGIRRRERIGLWGNNSTAYVILLFALWRLGAIAVPLNIRNPWSLVKALLSKITIQKVVFFDLLPAPKGDGAIFFLKGHDFVTGKKTLSGPKQKSFLSLQQPLTILFTSGTLSFPKAALHSFGNHYWNALGANKNLALTVKDRWALSLPLYHVSGLGVLFRSFLAGAAVVIPNAKEKLPHVLQKQSPTHISLVAAQLQRLIKNPACIKKLKAMKGILLGGGPAVPSLIQQAINLQLPLRMTYGLTEMASQVATATQDISKEKRATCSVLPYRALKISKTGEIFVKGKTLFLGYVTGRRILLPIDRHGWFRTADLGALDKDGYLSVVGRKDNMFISAGENIQPEEIEQVLLTYPGIRDALVLPQKNSEFGMRPIAVLKVVPKKGVSKLALQFFLEKKLPRFKIPDQFYVWPGFLSPKTLKVKRRQLLDVLEKKPERLCILR